MSDHLALSPRFGDGDSVPDRLFQLVHLLFENTLEFFWSLVTSKSQLERILEDGSHVHRAAQMSRLEECLRKKGTLRMRKMFRNGECSEQVMKDSDVRAEGERRDLMKQRLDEAITIMDSYEALIEQVESLRSEKFDSSNGSHEERLLLLWQLTMPDEELEARIGKQWRHIGFQGDDPSTDFRGMGVLSLDQMIYLASHQKDEMASILGLSHHPQIGFPMAIAGITITSLTRHLLVVGRLKKHFYNGSRENPIDMETFHQAYCRIFVLFCDYWKRANPPSVMSFNAVRLSFERSLADVLNLDSAHLDSITVDDLS